MKPRRMKVIARLGLHSGRDVRGVSIEEILNLFEYMVCVGSWR